MYTRLSRGTYIYPICTSICQPRPSRANRSRAEAAAPLSPPSTICAVRHCKQAMGPPLVPFHQHLYTLSKRTRHAMRVSHHVSHVRTLIYLFSLLWTSALDQPTNQPTGPLTQRLLPVVRRTKRIGTDRAKQSSTAKQSKSKQRKRKENNKKHTHAQHT